MQVMKGGSGRPSKKSAAKKAKVDKSRRIVEDIEDGAAAPKSKPQITFPFKIEVRQPSLRGIVPGHVWRQPAFKFDPRTFAPESEKLNDRFLDASKQQMSFRMFMEDPTLRMIYGVSGNPDDSKAKYFAAYLVHRHIQHLGTRANVQWHSLYGGFTNQLLEDAKTQASPPTMLVLCNLTPNSTNVKLEKARDLIEHFNNIPRIVVIAGEDPVSFLATRLFVPTNGIAYFAESLIKQKIEII